MLSSGFRFYLKVIFYLYLVACLITYVVLTVHWKQVNDPAQIHYLCFLMDHGMAPYRDLIEMNMPGTYLVNWTVMHTLGPGSLAWRCFDYLLMLMAAWAIIAIVRPYSWMTGAWAATLFILFHAHDGAGEAGQRDLIIAVLLLCSYAFLFHSLRTGKNAWMLGFGITAGIAVTLKPTPLPFILLLAVLAAVYSKHKGQPVLRLLGYAFLGMVVPCVVVLSFLISEHAFGAFLRTLSIVLPYYASIGRLRYDKLLAFSLSSSTRILLLLSLVIAFKRQDSWRFDLRLGEFGVLLGKVKEEQEWSRWESKLLGLGILFGFFSYLVQGKGMTYHRYPIMAFAFVWISVQIARGMKSSKSIRWVALAGLIYGLVTAPLYLRETSRKIWKEDYLNSLSSDLNQLGGNALSGQVQCLTTQPECHTVLYRMHLMQSTGLFYDFLIFGPAEQRAIQEARENFWQQLQKNPPKVIIVHSGLYPQGNGYEKLTSWPLFSSYLSTSYTLYRSRSLVPFYKGDLAYRLYVRK